MSVNKIAFIFPAFTDDFHDHPMAGNGQFLSVFSNLLHDTRSSNAPHLSQFKFNDRVYDQIDIQYLTYIYSCAAGEFLKTLDLKPSYIAGYSMGIYAALFYSGSITFHAGLEMIRLAYRSLEEAMPNQSAGMGTIIGLTRSDILQLIEDNSLNTEITNQNALHSFVISGLKADVQSLLCLAHEEGALHTRDLMVSLPYHYSHLTKAAAKFGDSILNMEIRDPETRIISLLDQFTLTSHQEIRLELIRNLHNPLNWLKTQQLLLDHGISLFIEAGASRGLMKNARFMEGKYKFLTLDSVIISRQSPS